MAHLFVHVGIAKNGLKYIFIWHKQQFVFILQVRIEVSVSNRIINWNWVVLWASATHSVLIQYL